MLPSSRNPAVLEVEDDAAINIQEFPVSHSAVVMNTDHTAAIGRTNAPIAGA